MVSAPLGLSVREFHLFDSDAERHLFVVPTCALVRVDETGDAVLRALLPQRGRPFDRAAWSATPVIQSLAAAARDELLENLVALGVLSDGQESAPDRDRLLPYAQPPVQTVTALVADSCNLACGYCYADQGKFEEKNTEPMEIATAKRLLDLLLRQSGDAEEVTYQFLGGEPLLRAALLREVVAYGEAEAARAGKRIRFGLTTNGTFLTSEIVRFFLDHEIQCTISIDGPEEVHDRVRVNHAGKGSYARVVAAVRPLVRARATRARVTVTKSYLDIEAIIDHLLDEGFFEVGITPVSSKDPAYALTDADRDVLLAAMRRLSRRYVEEARAGKRFGFANLTQLLKQIHEGRRHAHPCGAGIGLFGVDGAGTLYPCHRFPGREEYALGTVETGIDRAKQAKWLSQVHVDNRSDCRSCWARYLCSGGCYHLSAVEYGDVTRTFTPICDHLRAWYEMGLAAYAALAESRPDVLASITGAARAPSAAIHSVKGEA